MAVAKRLISALVAGAVVALWVREWRAMGAARRRARSILYPGDPDEISEVLERLRGYTDDDSRALVRQLEDHLKKSGRRVPRAR
jgi:hypothetical protein